MFFLHIFLLSNSIILLILLNYTMYRNAIAYRVQSVQQDNSIIYSPMYRVFHKPSNKPTKLKRHKMIAQAFEKRKEINQGRVSISYLSSHDDPLGMKFDLNSCSDEEMSANFAMAMPQLVRRRGGLIYPSSGMGRR